jgi:hypothetical protein
MRSFSIGMRGCGRSTTTRGFRDFSSALRRAFFKEFMTSQNLDCDDARFLSQHLPRALGNLLELRNKAEHGPSKTWHRDEVAPVLREFLGIGEPGILPRLASLSKELTGQTSRGGRSRKP